MNSTALARKLLDGFTGRSPVEAQLIRFCELIATGKQGEIYSAMRAEKSINDSQKKEIIGAINEAHFLPQRLEWTNHGIIRTFRFWTADEKAAYLRRALEIVEALKPISPNVCFGFGSVLGFVRDADFISHDDDMDLLVAFPWREGCNFGEAKRLVKTTLEAAGFKCHGENLSHYGVNRGVDAAVDVFIGFIEPDESISWFPSRRGLHKVESIFPATTFRLFGVECPIPLDPELYLANTYGADWRHPIPNWNHPWDRAQYEDYVEQAVN